MSEPPYVGCYGSRAREPVQKEQGAFHEPGKHSTFNIQRPKSKAGAKRSALDVQSWALNVEGFPCGSGVQGMHISGESLPVIRTFGLRISAFGLL
jgi:hypothetical protein